MIGSVLIRRGRDTQNSLLLCEHREEVPHRVRMEREDHGGLQSCPWGCNRVGYDLRLNNSNNVGRGMSISQYRKYD